MDNGLTPNEKITRAKIQLNYTNPFFAYLVVSLKPHERKNMPTAGVNINADLYYNPSFVDKLSEEELQFLLCHECSHLAYGHLWRAEKRDKYLFNWASDLTINTLLKANGFTLIKDCLSPNDKDEWIYQGITIKDVSKKSSEELYDEIYQLTPKINMTDFLKMLNDKSIDKHFYSGEQGEGTGTPIIVEGMGEEDWKRKLIEANVYAHQQGKEPLGMGRFIDKLLHPKLNWRQILKQSITSEYPVDFSYARPSRRSVSTGFYMPYIKKENLDIGVSIDTSGSITQKELTIFVSELVGIANSFEAIKMTLVTHDTEVYDETEITNANKGRLATIKIHGSGGTSHKNVYAWAKKKGIKLLVCFTDLCSDLNTIKTPINTIFVTLTDQKAPFGKTIKMETN